MSKSPVETSVEKQARVYVQTYYSRKAREARVRKALSRDYADHVVAYLDATGQAIPTIMCEAHNVATARRWYGALRSRFVAAVGKLDNARLHATFAKGRC